MENELKSHLFDVLNAVNEIDSYFLSGTKDFEYFKKDLKTKRAVERNLEIIGEAMSRILKQNTTIEISNSKKNN